MKQHLIQSLGLLLAAAAIHTHAQDGVRFLPRETEPAPGTPPARVEHRPRRQIPIHPAPPPRPRGRHDPYSTHNPFSDRIPRPLLILSSAPDEKAIDNIREDLAVMSRILDKNVSEVASDASFRAMGIELLTFPGSKPTRNIFIQDYGVIFTLRVNMPLLAPETPEDAEADSESDPVDTAWEEARGELFGHPARGRDDRPPSAAYDADSVERLKQTLIESLRAASNIRNLSDSDRVTIVVTGQSSSAAGGDFQRALRFEFKEVFVWHGDPQDEPASTLVISASKSDIDQFAEDEDLDAFKEKVATVIY